MNRKRGSLLLGAFMLVMVCGLFLAPDVLAEDKDLTPEETAGAETAAWDTDYPVTWQWDTLTKPYKVVLDKNGILDIAVEKVKVKDDNVYWGLTALLYDENGKVYYAISNSDRDVKDADLCIGLTAGTYYFRMVCSDAYGGGDTTKFRVSFEATEFAEREPNTTKETATPMIPDTQYTGYYGGRCYRDYDDGYDVFKITLKKNTMYKFITSVTNKDAICVLNTKDKEVTDFWNDIDARKDFIAPYTGEYYICIYNRLEAQFKYTLMVKTIGELPKATKINSLTGAKKSFTLKWVVKNCGGYEVQYSLNSKMTNAVKKKISKASTKKLTVKKLKAKKTYYVRIRTFKKLDGKLYYSAWTKAKKVKTK